VERDREEDCDYASPVTREAVVELLLRLEDDLDADWTLDAIAKHAGYAKHHFARAFTEIVGTPPIEYVRVLRIHRAAQRLAVDPDFDVFAAADQARYGSEKAFRRAFEREMGRTPGAFRREHAATRGRETAALPELPPGLKPTPSIEVVGPLDGLSLRSSGLSPADVRATMLDLFALLAPQGAWRIGSSSPPLGWTGSGAMRRQIRCIYLTETVEPPTSPIERWHMGAHRFARFDYDGPTMSIAAAYLWIFDSWMGRSPWRYAFAPVVTLYDDAIWRETAFERASARIYVPIERR